jgi:hypothetical protein
MHVSRIPEDDLGHHPSLHGCISMSKLVHYARFSAGRAIGKKPGPGRSCRLRAVWRDRRGLLTRAADRISAFGVDQFSLAPLPLLLLYLSPIVAWDSLA